MKKKLISKEKLTKDNSKVFGITKDGWIIPKGLYERIKEATKDK